MTRSIASRQSARMFLWLRRPGGRLSKSNFILENLQRHLNNGKERVSWSLRLADSECELCKILAVGSASVFRRALRPWRHPKQQSSPPCHHPNCRETCQKEGVFHPSIPDRQKQQSCSAFRLLGCPGKTVTT